jgi:glycosyltransferase involved in cell wall biosynthesis
MSLSQPLISVVVPVGRNMEYLEECLDSILDQTLSDIEILCVFDGAPVGATDDKSDGIRKALCEKDPRIRRITIPESGPGAARNAGLDAAAGAYIAFCDADDILPYRSLEYLYSKMQVSRADVVMGSFIEQFDSGNSVLCVTSNQGMGFDRFFAYISVWNRLYRHDFLSEHGIRFVPKHQGEDLLFLADVFLSRPKVATTRKVVYQWQRHEMDKTPTLTHFDSVQSYLELLDSWHTFLDRMTPDFEEAVKYHGRDACPYLLARLGNIEGLGRREEAFQHLLGLVRRMDWDRHPVRFKKLFRTAPAKLLHPKQGGLVYN